MPRKTNYDFERREREKTKAVGKAEKVQSKADRKITEQEASESPEAEES